MDAPQGELSPIPQDASAEATEHLRGIADAAPLLIGYIGLDHCYRFNNRAYTEWFGFGAGEMLGKHVSEVIGVEAYESVRSHLDEAAAGRVSQFDVQMHYHRGGARYVHSTFVPDRDPAGRVQGIVIFVTDNSALHQAQEDLMAAYKREVVVNTIARAARSATDPAVILQTTTEVLGKALNADRCYYVTYDQKRGRGTVGPDWRREGLPSIAGEYDMFAYHLNRNAAYLAGATDVVEDSFALPDNAMSVKLGLRALVRAPVHQNEMMTALVVAMASEPRQWLDRDVSLVETIATQTRGAVEAARARLRERAFLRDVLASVTGGKLLLCEHPSQLPPIQTLSGGRIAITSTGALREIRQATQRAAQLCGHTPERELDLVTAASEAGMNVIVHAGGGTAYVSHGDDGVVQVRVEDQGLGITMENLPKAAFARGFSTKSTLGHGLKMMLETADRVYLLTGSTGTIVVLEQERVPPLPAWL
ncbi:MAG: histidine kinase [Capsulimonas sp.]|nr:histidine kinase [Capsulimonas sp.]